MPDINVVAVLVATGVSFLFGGAYYAILGDQLASVSAAGEAGGVEPQMPPWKLPVELLRNLLPAAVVAGITAHGDINVWTGGLLLGLALWAGIPLVLWIGAVIHENVPWKLAVIHAGDWLVKLLAISTLISVLQ